MARPEFIEWVETGGARRRCGDFEYIDGLPGSQASYYGRKVQVIERVSGEWPSDKDLITIADGDDPESPHHFGGQVHTIGTDRRSVHILTD